MTYEAWTRSGYLISMMGWKDYEASGDYVMKRIDLDDVEDPTKGLYNPCKVDELLISLPIDFELEYHVI